MEIEYKSSLRLSDFMDIISILIMSMNNNRGDIDFEKFLIRFKDDKCLLWWERNHMKINRPFELQTDSNQ